MKIEKKELLLEIEQMLKEEFIAKIREENGVLILRFYNGKEFRLMVNEIT